jgi:hypothetical protein
MRIKHLAAFLFIALAMLASPFSVFGQLYGSEADAIKQAKAAFDMQDYAKAMPLYSGLLANHIDDPNYNYYYGVCVLNASSEKDKALKYLEKASKSPGVNVDVWYYLGKAYHLNYQFEQAIISYNKYKTLASPKQAEKMQVDNQIAMCKTGRKMLKAITDITVIDKAELDKANFISHYDLSGAGYSGQLLIEPDEFKTALDKKKNEQSVIFLSGEKNELYFASYGADESQGKDIYRVRKLPDGRWGNPYNVGYPINTEYDEDYPFLHPNGKVLYFSSKGHNSMGGYDIFRAELNEETGTFEKPVNLDFAINSTDDDIMFVSDAEEKTAWFASNRNSPDGKMTVYHVMIDRKPVNMCMISGIYTPTNGDKNLSAKITVKNAETNEPIGVFKSNETTGKYFMNLPNNGGKYTFTVDHGGIATQTESVIIPPQYSIKTINQEIGYKDLNNETKMFIRTDFETDSSMLDPTFLKDKAKLDTNASEAYGVVDVGNDNYLHSKIDSNALVKTNPKNPDTTNTAFTDPSTGIPPPEHGVTNEEAVKTAYDDADATKKDASSLTQQANRAFAYANDLNNQAKAKSTEAEQAKKDADAMPDGPDKTTAEQHASDLQAEANALQAQTVAAAQVAQALDGDAKRKTEEGDKAQFYATTLDKAIKNNDKKALDQAAALEKDLSGYSDANSDGSETVKNLNDAANAKHVELDKAKANTQDLKDGIALKQQHIDSLKASEAKTKDPDDRQTIEDQISGVKDEITDDQKDLATAQAKQDKLQNEANDLDNQAKGANDLIAQSKNTSVAPTPVSDGDKKALASDVVVYQQNVSETGTARVFKPIVGGGVTDPIANHGTDPVASGVDTLGTDAGTDSTDNSVATTENPDLPYTNSLKDADTISDPVVRENTKADIYKNWAATIDDEIKDKKQDLAGTTDKTKKSQLNSEIKTLQQQENQQKTNSKQSLAAADKAKQQQSSIAGTQAGTQPVVSNPNDQFVQQLNTAEQKPNTVAKENAKAQVYNDWADTLDARADAEANQMLKTKNKKQKDAMQADIAKLHDEANEKRGLADEAKSSATTAETAGTSNGGTNPVASTEVHYDNPEATTSLTDKKELLNQSDQFHKTQDSLTALAGTKTGKEKTKLLSDATTAQSAAWKTDEQASEKQGQANRAQFNSNQEQLKGFEDGAKTTSDPGVAAAALLTDDANNYFTKAKQERDSAANSNDHYTKSELLNNAEENERKGILKQQEAIAQYQKSGVQPIASNQSHGGTDPVVNHGTDPIVNHGVDTTTNHGTDPIVNHGTDPVVNHGTDPIVNHGVDTTTNHGTDPVVNHGTDPVVNHGTDPVVNHGTDPIVNHGVDTTTNHGTDPVVNHGTDPVVNHGTDPVVNHGTDPVVNHGTDPVVNHGTDPVVNHGTDPVVNHGTDPVVNHGTDPQPVIDPVTGNPLTQTQMEEIRGTDTYKKYVDANNDAVKADQNVADQKAVADNFQKSADANISKAQDLSLQAADENDPTKKKELLADSKKYNDAARNDMSSRDSVNDIVSDASADAKIKHNKADFILESGDQNTSAKVKAVAQNDQQNNSNGARNGNPDGAQNHGIDPIVNHGVDTTTTTHGGTDPIVNHGTDPIVNHGTDPIVNHGVDTTTSHGGADPIVNHGTDPIVNHGTDPIVNHGVDTTTNHGTDPIINHGGTDPGTSPVTKGGGTNTSTVASRLAPGEQFKINSQPVTPKIPVNPVLPEGLVYKVQIGAFRNPPSPAIYQNIQPVSAETTPSGLTRYTAGFFTQFANADAAKNEIRGMGYKDAFVVAFYHGKRISMDDANRIAAGQQPIANNGGNDNHGGTDPIVNHGVDTASSHGTDPVVNHGTDPNVNHGGTQYNSSPVVDVKDVKGLFYTVQIGVYRTDVNKSQLKNLPEIVSDHLPNGLIRYSSGKYCSEDAATTAKNNAVAKGISDAFVCAYYNGKRITPDEARVLESQGVSPCSDGQTQTPVDNTPLVTPVDNGNNNGGNNHVTNPPVDNGNNNGGNNHVTNPPVDNGNNNGGNNHVTNPPVNNPPVDNTPVVHLNTTPPVPDTGLVFAVQIGAFREEVPVSVANQFLQLSDLGVKNYYDKSTELTVYQVGAVTTKEEADALRGKAISKGITDAFVVAFKDGKKISMEEAMQLLGQ